MRRILSALLIAPPTAVAGFYLASFVFRLVVGLLHSVTTGGLIMLFLLGIVSRDTPTAPFFPLLALEWLRTSPVAFQVAGFAGAAAALVLIVIAASSWRRALVAGAAVVGLAGVAGAGDLYYGVTPYVDRLMPHSSLAAAQQDVTCRLTVLEVAQLPDKLSGCVAEVEGVLVYEERMRRFVLSAPDERQPAIKVYFFRGRRTFFAQEGGDSPPRFYDQVSGFTGKRVRIVGTAVNGASSADVGHIVLADAQIQ